MRPARTTFLFVLFLLLSPLSVQAQGMADVASGLRTDPDSPPIEIEADQLDIYDKKSSLFSKAMSEPTKVRRC